MGPPNRVASWQFCDSRSKKEYVNVVDYNMPLLYPREKTHPSVELWWTMSQKSTSFLY